MSLTTAVSDRPSSFSASAAPTNGARFRVLVADDQREVIHALRLLFNAEEITTLGATSPAEALSLVRAHPIDAALVDLNYEAGRTSGDQGLQLVSELHDQAPHLPIVVMTAWGSIDLAVEAARRGAGDFVEKPWDETRLVTLMRAHAELGRARQRIAALEDEVKELRLSETARTGTPAANLRLQEVERLLVRKALEQSRGNISGAARALGLSRSAMYRRLARHQIES